MKRLTYTRPSMRIVTMAPSPLLIVSGGIEGNTIPVHEEEVYEAW